SVGLGSRKYLVGISVAARIEFTQIVAIDDIYVLVFASPNREMAKASRRVFHVLKQKRTTRAEIGIVIRFLNCIEHVEIIGDREGAIRSPNLQERIPEIAT